MGLGDYTEWFGTLDRPSQDLTIGHNEMEGFTESVALDLEVSFFGVGHIIIILSVAAALLHADRSFTLQSLQTGS